MRKEENCKQSERFLQAVSLFSDKTIEVWKKEIKKSCKIENEPYNKFTNWIKEPNEVAIVTMYAYANFSIPKKFDCIFLYDNPVQYIHSDFTLTQSIFEGYLPIDYIEHGCKHLCIFKFENNIPEIIKHLHYETKKHLTWNWDVKKVLGFCQLSDIQSIIDRRLKEAKLKELHGENWCDFDDET